MAFPLRRAGRFPRNSRCGRRGSRRPISSGISTVGNLMGALLGGSIFIEGLFARMMYVGLFKMHLYALHGFAKVALDTLARLITRRTEPRVKLH